MKRQQLSDLIRGWNPPQPVPPWQRPENTDRRRDIVAREMKVILAERKLREKKVAP